MCPEKDPKITPTRGYHLEMVVVQPSRFQPIQWSKKQAQQVLQADFPSPSFFYPVPSCKKFTPSFTWCWNILKHGHFGVMCWNVLKHGKSFPWSPMLKHDLPGVNLLYRSIQRAQSSRSRGWGWRLAESEAPDVDFLAVVTVTLISDHFEH